MAGKRKKFVTKEELIKLYEEYRSAYKIAEIYNVNHKTVYGLMKHYGIKTTTGSQGARTNNLNHDFFKEIDTPEKAYWFGFLMADGCVYKGSGGKSYRLQINLQGKDIGHLEKFQKSIGSSYKIQEKKYKEYNVAILKINSTVMCKDLMRHGLIERKSIICQYPKSIKHHSDFIRGYFDGDGCITYRKDFQKYKFIITGGEDMLEEIQKVLPVKSNLYCIKHSDAIDLCVNKKEDILRLYKWLYEGAEVYLDRKYEKYKRFYSNHSMSPMGVIP